MDRIGRYEIERTVAAGGFGVVYRARDPLYVRTVAIKVFRPADEALVRRVAAASGDPLRALRRRFLQEAEVVQTRLAGSPHVVPVFGVDLLADGTPYYVMPFYERSLRQEIGRDPSYPWAIEEPRPDERPRPLARTRALALLRQVAQALAAVHRAGIVHRDVKPANLMLDARGDVVLVDFGIAKVPDPDATRTVSGEMMGTARWMAPEQRESARHVDARTDVYAWGLLACRLLTGVLPAEGFRDSIFRLPSLPPELAPLVQRCLEPRASERPADGTALLAAFEADAPAGRRLERSTSITNGDEFVRPPPPSELAPLQKRVDALLLEHGEIPQREWLVLEELGGIADLERVDVQALVDTEAERLADRVAPLRRFLRRVDARIAEHGTALPEPVLRALSAAAETIGWDRERVEEAIRERGGAGARPFVPETVAIPQGRFRMGDASGASSEQPLRIVHVPAFRMTKYAVTFDQYDAFADATGGRKPRDFDRGRVLRPVVDVNWHDAVAFAEWLSAQTGDRWRLPSEAEWEYAARAGTESAYPWGDDIGRNRCNCSGSGSEWSGKGSAPVGSFPANAFGLHDMHGNVWEWTADCWHESYAGGPTDGRAWGQEGGGDCSRRVLRGGSWGNYPRNARSADRIRRPADARSNDRGFRLVQDAR
jgi:formylglycine-generating enzyme required for sulfatase activity/serine/threonine protein kinase